jgi:hypothetical protein
MDTTKETRVKRTEEARVLEALKIPQDVAAKMLDYANRTSERCVICHVGRGRRCAHR